MSTERVIKFRAWDTIKKEWFNNNGGFAIDWDASHITDDNDERMRTRPTIVLQQFTGLQDKAGKEIYEGDIIKWDHYRQFSSARGLVSNGIGSVYWSEDVCWRVNIHDKGIRELLVNAYHSCEVIGNIYSSPSSIEESKAPITR